MLLNEAQKQARQLAQQSHQLTQKDAQIAALQLQLATVQKKSIEFDARMAARMDALEQQARAARPERFAAATR